MASKLGPLFALSAKGQSEWTSNLRAHSETQVVVQTADRAFVLEIMSEKFRQELLSSPQNIWIYLAQILREDEEVLFGFADMRERSLFEEIREIDGIGPKSAALLVGKVGLDGFHALVLDPKKAQSIKISGLGAKSLEKVALGLKQKQKHFLQILGDTHSGSSERVSSPSFGEVPTDLENALMQLGLKAHEVKTLYDQICKEQAEAKTWPVTQLLQEALKMWGRGRSAKSTVTRTGEA